MVIDQRIVRLMPAILVLAVVIAIFAKAASDYNARHTVNRASHYGKEIEDKVTQYFRQHGQFPSDLAAINVPTVHRYFDWELEEEITYKIALADRVIAIEFSDHQRAIRGKTLVFKPVLAGEEIHWDCTGGTVSAIYRPVECQP